MFVTRVFVVLAFLFVLADGSSADVGSAKVVDGYSASCDGVKCRIIASSLQSVSIFFSPRAVSASLVSTLTLLACLPPPED